MSDFIILYNIIPVGDGINCLCKDNSDKYFTNIKSITTKEKLVFDTELTVQRYIDKYLDSDKYKPEAFLCNVDYLPENIIREV